MLRYIFNKFTSLPAKTDTSFQRCHLRTFRSLSPTLNCIETSVPPLKFVSSRRSHSFPRSNSYSSVWQAQYNDWLSNFNEQNPSESFAHPKKYHKNTSSYENYSKSSPNKSKTAKESQNQNEDPNEFLENHKLQYSADQYELDSARPRKNSDNYKRFKVIDDSEIRRGDPTGHLQPRNIKPFGSSDTYSYPAHTSRLSHTLKILPNSADCTEQETTPTGSTSGRHVRKLNDVQCRRHSTSSRMCLKACNPSSQTELRKNFSMNLEEKRDKAASKSFFSYPYSRSEQQMKLPQSKSLDRLLNKHKPKTILGVNKPYKLSHVVSAEKVKKKLNPELTDRLKQSSSDITASKENALPSQINTIMSKYMKVDPNIKKGPSLLQKILQKTNSEKLLVRKLKESVVRSNGSKNYEDERNIHLKSNNLDSEVSKRFPEFEIKNVSPLVGSLSSNKHDTNDNEEDSSSLKSCLSETISGYTELTKEVSKNSKKKYSKPAPWKNLNEPPLTVTKFHDMHKKSNPVKKMRKTPSNRKIREVTDVPLSLFTSSYHGGFMTESTDKFKPRVFGLNDLKFSEKDNILKNSERTEIVDETKSKDLGANDKNNLVQKVDNSEASFKSTKYTSKTLADQIRSKQPPSREKITFNLRPAKFKFDPKDNIPLSNHFQKDVISLNDSDKVSTDLVAEIIPIEDGGCLPPLEVVDVCDISDSPNSHLNAVKEASKLLTSPEESPKLLTAPATLKDSQSVNSEDFSSVEINSLENVQVQKRYFVKPRSELSEKLRRGSQSVFSRRNFSTNYAHLSPGLDNLPSTTKEDAIGLKLVNPPYLPSDLRLGDMCHKKPILKKPKTALELNLKVKQSNNKKFNAASLNSYGFERYKSITDLTETLKEKRSLTENFIFTTTSLLKKLGKLEQKLTSSRQKNLLHQNFKGKLRSEVKSQCVLDRGELTKSPTTCKTNLKKSSTSILKNMKRPGGDWIAERRYVSPNKQVRFSDDVDVLKEIIRRSTIKNAIAPLRVEREIKKAVSLEKALRKKRREEKNEVVEVYMRPKLKTADMVSTNAVDRFQSDRKTKIAKCKGPSQKHCRGKSGLRLSPNQWKAANIVKSKTCHELSTQLPKTPEQKSRSCRSRGGIKPKTCSERSRPRTCIGLETPGISSRTHEQKNRSSQSRGTNKPKTCPEKSTPRTTCCTTLASSRPSNSAPRSTPGVSMGMLMHPPIVFPQNLRSVPLLSTRNFSTNGLIQTSSPIKTSGLKKKADIKPQNFFEENTYTTKIPSKDSPLKLLRRRLRRLSPELNEDLEKCLQILKQPTHRRSSSSSTMPHLDKMYNTKENDQAKVGNVLKKLNTAEFSNEKCNEENIKSIKTKKVYLLRGDSTVTLNSKVPSTEDPNKMPVRKYHMLRKLPERQLKENSFKNLNLKKELKDKVTSIENLRGIQWKINNFYKWHKLNDMSNIQITLKRFYSCMNFKSPSLLSHKKREGKDKRTHCQSLSVRSHPVYLNDFMSCNDPIRTNTSAFRFKIKKKRRSGIEYIKANDFLKGTPDKELKLEPKKGVTETSLEQEELFPNSSKRNKRNSNELDVKFPEIGNFKKEIFLPERKNFVSEEASPIKTPLNDEDSRSDNSHEEHKSDSVWQRLVNYFKARPNCPTPEEYRKKAAREKAEKYARMAGLILCEKDQLRKDLGENNEDLPKVITLTSRKKKTMFEGQKRELHSQVQKNFEEHTDLPRKIYGKRICGTNIIQITPSVEQIIKQSIQDKRFRLKNPSLHLQTRHFSTSMTNKFATNDKKIDNKEILNGPKAELCNLAKDNVGATDEKNYKITDLKGSNIENSEINSKIGNTTIKDENKEKLDSQINDDMSLDSVSTRSKEETFEDDVAMRKLFDCEVTPVAESEGSNDKEEIVSTHTREETLDDDDSTKKIDTEVISVYSTERSEDKNLDEEVKPEHDSVKETLGISTDKSMNLVPKMYSRESMDLTLKEINKTLEEKDKQRLTERIIRSVMEASAQYHDDIASSYRPPDFSDQEVDCLPPRLIPRKITLSEMMFSDPKDEFGKICQAKCLAVFLDIFKKSEVLSDINYEDVEKMKTNKLVNELNKLLIEDN